MQWHDEASRQPRLSAVHAAHGGGNGSAAVGGGHVVGVAAIAGGGGGGAGGAGGGGATAAAVTTTCVAGLPEPFRIPFTVSSYHSSLLESLVADDFIR
jgi:hypothetical protein